MIYNLTFVYGIVISFTYSKLHLIVAVLSLSSFCITARCLLSVSIRLYVSV